MYGGTVNLQVGGGLRLRQQWTSMSLGSVGGCVGVAIGCRVVALRMEDAEAPEGEITVVQMGRGADGRLVRVVKLETLRVVV